MDALIVDLFLARAPAESLEPVLDELWRSARARWPRIELGADVFFRHLLERLPDEGDPLRALQTIRAGDLYLACACSRGLPEAIEELEHSFIAPMSVSVPGRELQPSTEDEVKQRLRTRLLVDQDGTGPRIAGYTGRGPLGAWMRVAATRIAIDMRRATNPGDARSGDLDLQVAPQSDPELALLKARYGAELRQAIGAALAALEPREAAVLRMFFLQGMTLEAIGALYRTSNRSARRWVAQARKKILEEARRLLGEQLQVSANQLESIIRLAHDELGPSILEILGKPEKEPR